VRTRTFALAALLVTLLLAGVGSYYASSHPDGLEHVADRAGFLDTADDHPAGDGPMADYSVEGVDSPRLAGGLAGVVGVGVTLLVAGGLGYAVRRRRPRSEADTDPTEERV
jgi:cobalt/nickel transport protein